MPLPRNASLEHTAKIGGGETPQSYANGAHQHDAASGAATKKADQSVQKRPGVESSNSGEYDGMPEVGGGGVGGGYDTNQSADSSSSNSSANNSGEGDGLELDNTGSRRSISNSNGGGNYLSNLMPRSTDYGGGGGYNSPYGYPGYGGEPSQYLPREYLPPSPSDSNSYLALGQGQLMPGQAQLAPEVRQEKPLKKRKKPKGRHIKRLTLKRTSKRLE